MALFIAGCIDVRALPPERTANHRRSHTMTNTSAIATDAAPSYSDISQVFAKRYRAAHEQLTKLSDSIKKNEYTAEKLREIGKDYAARVIEQCGRRRVGASLNSLKPEFYCRQIFWCPLCMWQVAVNRRDRWVEANKQFALAVNCGELVLHRFLFQPRTAGATGDDFKDLELATRLLRECKRRLRLFHTAHNVSRFNAGKLYGKTLREQKASLCGPTQIAIHIVPQCVQHFKEQDFIHMHATIVTTRHVPVKWITKHMERIWGRARLDVGVNYRPKESEVTRKAQDDYWRDPTERQYRACHFPPLDPEHSATLGAAAHFSYLGLPFKTKWGSNGIANANQLVTQLGLPYRSINQALGMMGVQLKRLAHCFPAESLNPRFIAEFNGEEWDVFRRAENRAPGSIPVHGSRF